MAFDMAYDYLKKIHYKKIVMVAPIASIKAIDKMHIIADEIICLSVTNDIFDADHYFAINKMPDQDEITDILNNTALKWQNPSQLTNRSARVIRRHFY